MDYISNLISPTASLSSSLASSPGTAGITPSMVSGISSPSGNTFLPPSLAGSLSLPELLNPASPTRQIAGLFSGGGDAAQAATNAEPQMQLSSLPPMNNEMPLLRAIVAASMQRGLQGVGQGNG